MSRLTILHYPDPRLRHRAQPVSTVDQTVKRLVDDMFHTMYAAQGIGLAATQVNVQKQIIVVDVSKEGTQPVCFINPEIVERRGTTQMEEGCLSVPDVRENVERAEWIRVTALNEAGEAFEQQADGILAVCIQHEIDHLDGKLFVDYLSRLKRQRILTKAKKQQKK
uniref:Peptide deformylase n=1 Tax=Candidatus Kentrum sp. FM TaxID=2126340 RepID=A0A450X3E8_9GAMM|nr:MAG: peptide deformylase [Candidatus Kentron sp. FM]VFJ60952.1 MAG: peptide deformylase [Candidatus Kentron sp. FM]VFK23839.1 MAG: peptide deformylase [Candidatus Kentron sp. FM]